MKILVNRLESNSFCDIYQKPESDFLNRPCQGDIFKRDAINLDIKDISSIFGWIIINSTCDLVRPRLDYFFFAPIRPLRYFIEKSSYSKNKKKEYLSKILNYEMLRTFFLPSSSKINSDEPLFCQLGYIFSIPIGDDYDETCKSLLKYRIISLKPPWREKLGQIVGNNFSRIGVPEPRLNYKNWIKEFIEKII